MVWSDYVTSDMFMPIVTGITSLIPLVIAITAPLMAIRKGWDFLKGNIYAA